MTLKITSVVRLLSVVISGLTDKKLSYRRETA